MNKGLEVRTCQLLLLVPSYDDPPRAHHALALPFACVLCVHGRPIQKKNPLANLPRS